MMKKPIFDITPFSALDFPDHLSCIVWFAGCNMRCRYCYNPEIVRGEGSLEIEDLLAFLRSRQGLLDGVVLSGGEVTNFNELFSLCEKIKALGFKVKLDTNGSRPELIQSLLNAELIDYVALDFKAPKEKFRHVSQSALYGPFLETLELLSKSYKAALLDFEVRTTYHSSLLSEEDINGMIDCLIEKGYSGTYYLQNFRTDCETIEELPDHRSQLDRAKLSNALNVEFRNF